MSETTRGQHGVVSDSFNLDYQSCIVNIHTSPIILLLFIPLTQSTLHLYGSPEFIDISISLNGMILSSPDSSNDGLSSGGKS